MRFEKRLSLHEYAEGQDGLFTAHQAAEAGFRPNHFHHFIKTGEWVREGRGLYRLKAFPWAPRQEYWKVFLWSRNRSDIPQAVFSYQSALALNELSDVLPNRFHITVPTDFRRRSERLQIVELHIENLIAKDITLVHGLPCTTIVKTIIDLIGRGFSDQLLWQAINEARERGLVTTEELKELKLESNLNPKLDQTF